MAGTTRQDGVVRSLLLAIGLALGGLGVSGLLTGCGGKPPSLTHAEPLAPDRFPACESPGRCTEGYAGFLERAREHASPVAEDALWADLRTILHEERTAAKEVPAGTTLGAELRTASRVGWLLDDLRGREVPVVRGVESRWKRATQVPLQFDDPWVGRFDALLLIPDRGETPRPAVVAQPGHSESAVYHRDHRLVGPLIKAGYAVLILEPRINEGDEWEHRVSLGLLLEGHSLIGLRAYEMVVARDYLRRRADIDPDRIAMMGHSGGSSTANLVSFIEPCWAALVSDHTTWYMARFEDDGQISDEASADLWYWNELVHSTPPPMPLLRQDYGYPRGARPVLRFLEGVFEGPGRSCR